VKPATLRYVAAARELIDAIGGDAAIAGGIAVSVHGFPRATADIDVITSVPLSEARARLKRRGIVSTLRTGDRLEGDIPCLTGVVVLPGEGGARRRGVPFDVIPALVPIASHKIELDGRPVRVVDADTLIRLKLKAGSIQDLYDIAMLAHLEPRLRERAVALAAPSPRNAARLRELIEDPRTAAQARAVRRRAALGAARKRG
jgi:hypothetical protein